MTAPAVIGIHGKAGAGKDTLANMILGIAGGYKYSMADPIRAMLDAGFGINMSDPYWIAHKELEIAALGKSPRQMMQTLGTEWGRQLVKDDVWIILAQNKLIQTGRGMLIADVRFENEAEFVRKHGRLIHIVRDNAPAVAAHTSEAGVAFNPECDVMVFNNGSIEDLRNVSLGILELWGLVRERREATYGVEA